MKIVTPQQMSNLESLAYKEGCSESDFMEEAGSGVALFVQDYVERYNLDRLVILLCGKGNNAGDAYVAGLYLLHLEYEVFAIQPTPIEECSPLCRQSYERFMSEGGRSLSSLNNLPPSAIFIDGFFGTGFRGSISEPYASLIQQVNASHLPVISVDIPSGLNGETGEVTGPAIVATETTFLSLPKSGFFLNEGWNHVGKLRYVDFGLPKKYIESANTDLQMLTHEMMKPLLPPIKRSRHKYEAGYVVALAGSKAMPGAAMLSATAALRGGAGIVRLFYPEEMHGDLVTSPAELLRTAYDLSNLDEMLSHMHKASAILIGPGIGQTPEIKKLLHTILPQIESPCVLDADALNILSQNDIPLPKQTIFTPHHGEMMRLLHASGHPSLTLDFLKTCQEYALKKNITLVLKGAPTFILHPDGSFLGNPTGDPGMATAGSGDVLTGLIAALLAQGLSTKDAATLGVFLHGLSGEHAAEDMTSYSMCASDLIYRFPEAFKFLSV
jgi:ADP-dependent NAD(P)H-hydrate dehydratase / NAD(P)H-hydrate epimerase